MWDLADQELCVAMHEKTYLKSGDTFGSWNIYDCRK